MDLNQPIYLSQEEAHLFERFGGNSRLLSLSLQAMIEEDINAELEDISKSQSSSYVQTDTLKQVVNSLDLDMDFLQEDVQQVQHTWNRSFCSDGGLAGISNVHDRSSVMVDNKLPNHSHEQQQKLVEQFTSPQHQPQYTTTRFMQPPDTGMRSNGNGGGKISPTASAQFPATKKLQLSHPPGKKGKVSRFPKPVLSYTCLIGLALKNSPTGNMTVSEVYNFMCEHFPYFTTAPPGWKNSVRHNLSLNKLFTKIERPTVGGYNQKKGFLWAVNPLHQTKMDEEVFKWSRRDPMGIQKGMSMPESLEALERGEMVKDYNCSDHTIFSED